MRVAVVGAGIMGACAAWHLSQAGAQVTVVERAPGPAMGVTRWAMGWVGAGTSRPSEDPEGFARQIKALRDFARLEAALGGLPRAARGALLWHEGAEAAAVLVEEHRGAGLRAELVDGTDFAALEPGWAEPPSRAAHAPDDFVIEPVEFVRLLLLAAEEAGAAMRWSTEVEGIETSGGRVTGLRAGGGTVPAEAVVLANGTGSLALAAMLGAALPVEGHPAVLLRFDSRPGLLRRILLAPEMELRAGWPDGLVSAEDLPEEGEPGLPSLAERVGAAIERALRLPAPVRLRSVASAQRPITRDGRPLCGAVGDVEGLHAAVAHPGVMLAPWMGRTLAEAILA